MRARNGTKRQDERDESSARGNGVREECERLISARQTLRHDARADHGRQQYRGADGLGHKTPVQSRAHGSAQTFSHHRRRCGTCGLEFDRDTNRRRNVCACDFLKTKFGKKPLGSGREKEDRFNPATRGDAQCRLREPMAHALALHEGTDNDRP